MLDLNSPSLEQDIGSPLQQRPQDSALSIDGKFGVLSTQSTTYLEKCGSTLQIDLNDIASYEGAPPYVWANSHYVLLCTQYSDLFQGIYLPSLRLFRFTLPFTHDCEIQLGADAIYTNNTRERDHRENPA